jgi:dTDP-4-dehydrorhamnose reductase
VKILVTGKTGQVGYELVRSLQPLGEVVAVDSKQMDLRQPGAIREVIRTVQPDLIVNPAAYTAVDRAESEPEVALAINGDAPAIMAEEAKALGAAMIHFSTDYVFDGGKAGAYVEEDAPNPLNVYGKSKLAGEQALQASGVAHLIFRTSWVYGMRGRNFLLTVLRLAQEREELRIVADQHGAPTWCRTIAEATACIAGQAAANPDREQWWQRHSGIYHLTAQGQTTWHGFTQAILAHAGLKKLPTVLPISSAEYPTPALRPANSTLACKKLQQTFCELPAWNEALALCMEK